MATHTASAAYTNATDAQFRAWGSMISTALSTLGWVQTADTGQINWTTVLAPTVGNTIMGYEVWRMNDSLQSSSPVFMKIEYSSGAAAANPLLWFTFGTASNGTGTLTGHVTTRLSRTFAASASNVSSLFSGTSSRFSMFFGFGLNSAANGLWLNIERTRDASGNETIEGFIWAHGTSAAVSIQFVSTAAGLGVVETTLGVLMPSLGGGASGSSIAVYPVFATKGVFLNPLLGILGYFTATIGDGSSPAFGYYGNTHTYIALGVRVTTAILRGGSTGGSLMILWE